MDSPELFLHKKYWMDGMKNMRKINPDMRFMIITNDTEAAEKLLPGIKAYNFDLAKDYSIIKNAKYLLLANSSFTYFPAFTSETVKCVIAPKYWARHNVSDGYWASEQNIYTGFNYMDRKGKLFTAEECRKELEEYKKNSKKYQSIGKKLQGVQLTTAKLHAKYLIYQNLFIRMLRSLKRRMGI